MACEPGIVELCCGGVDRIKLIAWQVFQTGFVPLTTIFNPTQIDKLFRTWSRKEEVYFNNAGGPGDFIGSREEILTIPDPSNSMIEGGTCPPGFQVITTGQAFSGAQFPLGVTSRTEDKLVREGTSFNTFHRLTHSLSNQFTAETVFGKLDSIHTRVTELFDQIVWVNIPPPRGAVIGAAMIGEFCGGVLGMPGIPSMTGLVGLHGIERAYMSVGKPGAPDYGRDGGDIGQAHWRAYEQVVFAEVSRRYCLVRRSGIPLHLPDEGNLTGGTTEGCETIEGNGSRVAIRAPRCELNSNTAVDFYTSVSQHPAPICCGLAP
jgi:hypothetical protein